MSKTERTLARYNHARINHIEKLLSGTVNPQPTMFWRSGWQRAWRKAVADELAAEDICVNLRPNS